MDASQLNALLPRWASGLELCPSKRRQATATLELTADRRVVVRVPSNWGEVQIAALVKRQTRWLEAQHRALCQFEPRITPRTYLSGESHRHLGEQLMLEVVANSAGRDCVSVAGKRLLVQLRGRGDDPARVAALLGRWRLAQARAVFEQRLQHCMTHHAFMRFSQPRLQLRTMRRRWGSLSVGGVLTLNPMLVQGRLSAIDAVIHHELCHLLHRGHTPQFFALLDSVNPVWRIERARLELMLA